MNARCRTGAGTPHSGRCRKAGHCAPACGAPRPRPRGRTAEYRNTDHCNGFRAEQCPLNSDAMAGNRSPSPSGAVPRRDAARPVHAARERQSIPGWSMSHTIGDTSASPCRSAGDSNVSRTGAFCGQPSSSASQTQSAPSVGACSMPSANRLRRRGFGVIRGRSSAPWPATRSAHPLVEVVVDDDEVVDHARLGAQHVEGLGQFVGAAVGDDDGAPCRSCLGPIVLVLVEHLAHMPRGVLPS